MHCAQSENLYMILAYLRNPKLKLLIKQAEIIIIVDFNSRNVSSYYVQRYCDLSWNPSPTFSASHLHHIKLPIISLLISSYPT